MHIHSALFISGQASGFAMMPPATGGLSGPQAQKAGWEELETLGISIKRKKPFSWTHLSQILGQKLPSLNRCALSLQELGPLQSAVGFSSITNSPGKAELKSSQTWTPLGSPFSAFSPTPTHQCPLSPFSSSSETSQYCFLFYNYTVYMEFSILRANFQFGKRKSAFCLTRT